MKILKLSFLFLLFVLGGAISWDDTCEGTSLFAKLLWDVVTEQDC